MAVNPPGGGASGQVSSGRTPKRSSCGRRAAGFDGRGGGPMVIAPKRINCTVSHVTLSLSLFTSPSPLSLPLPHFSTSSNFSLSLIPARTVRPSLSCSSHIPSSLLFPQSFSRSIMPPLCLRFSTALSSRIPPHLLSHLFSFSPLLLFFSLSYLYLNTEI